MSKKDYYEVLGLKKGASEKEIKKNYKNLAKVHHPDKGGDENTFKEINEAYEVLKDAEKRSNYDKYGHSDNRRSSDTHYRWSDMMRNHFHQQNRPTGQNIRLNIKITLEESFTGVNKAFKYNRLHKCSDCNGQGGHDETTCPYCHGSGMIREVFNTQMGVVQNITTCLHCNGEGKTYETTCKTCNGQGVLLKEDDVNINIPSGVNNGDNMVVHDKGHAIKNGDDGHLLVVINVLEHEHFVRNESDLRYIKKLSYLDAILGIKIEVPTIEGGIVKVDIPQYSNNETILRLKGKGMTNVNSNLRGDYMIVIEVVLPKEINDEERELLEKLKVIKENVEK